MVQQLILYAGFAGITVFLGGLLAIAFKRKMAGSAANDEIVHGLQSFGAGIILSALALVLIPKGLEELALWPMASSFMVGALLFLFIDMYLDYIGGQMATLLAMLMDFVPESIALGAVFAIEPSMAGLLAVFIGLQNLPEAFNAFRDLEHAGIESRKILVIFFFLSFLGILGALFGHFVLSGYPDLTAHLMVFASGGILYLLIQDMIPESKLKNNHLTSLGAILGFLVGIIGEKLI